ncbi:Histidinol dehydrogenase, partial [Salmonella enterica subsp. enterica serovar Rubislaw str. A4-653]
MSFNTLIDWNSCSPEQQRALRALLTRPAMNQRALLTRPAISASDSITRTVSDILDNVKTRGDDALREYSAKFDKTEVTALRVTPEEIAAAGSKILKRSI